MDIYTGIMGATGPIGGRGLRGLRGPRAEGFVGPTGPRGLPGHIVAIGATGPTGAAGPSLVPTPGNAPPDMTSIASTADSITIQLTPVADYPDGLAIERSANGTTGWTEIARGVTTEYVDTAVAPDTTYFYRARAHWGPFYTEYTEVGEFATVAANAPPTLTMWGDEDCEEAGGTVQLDNAFTVADADDATLAVTIAVSGADGATLTLAGTTGLTFTVGDGTADTAMTFSGTPSAINTALRGSVFTCGDESTSGQEAAIVVTVSDGTNTPVEDAMAVFIVEAVSNEAPVLANVTGTTAYDFHYDGTPIAPALTLTDSDDTHLTGATVVIQSGKTSGDRLARAVADGTGWTENGITWSWNYSTGTLTASGSATKAEYQAQLRAIRFDNSNGVAGSQSYRVCRFQVTDGTDVSNTQDRSVTVAWYTGTFGTWDWLGDNSGTAAMDPGEASYDGFEVPLFNPVDKNGVNHVKRLMSVQGASMVDVFGSGTVELNAFASEMPSYWSATFVDTGIVYGSEPGGEVTIVVGAPAPPQEPQGLFADGTGLGDPSTELRFVWAVGDAAEATEVEYCGDSGAAPDGFWVSLGSIPSGDPQEVTITGLDPETTYWCRARSVKGGSIYSDWVQASEITAAE